MFSKLRRAIALLLIVIALGMIGCGDRNAPMELLEGDEVAAFATNPLVGAMAEVSPPERIQQLKPFLDVYDPQVLILSPRDNDVIEDTTVTIELKVLDIPIYKDADLGLGPHLHLFLDNEPYQDIYDLETSITFTDLAPGTHTIKVLAARPWGESFKNEGAYDQVTFDVFAPSPQNDPDSRRILLTYSQPQGTYGAEPILLDFYLKNAPLHLVAANDESIADWRIRCTVNGESFVFDRWQPIYLRGFNPGKNWVKLEVIDENGNRINNASNTGIRVIDYQPGAEDSLSRLIRGEIPLAQAKVLVDPNYTPPAPPVPEPAESVEKPADVVEEDTREEDKGAIAPSASEPSVIPESEPAMTAPEADSEPDVPVLETPEAAIGEESEADIGESAAPDTDVDVDTAMDRPQPRRDAANPDANAVLEADSSDGAEMGTEIELPEAIADPETDAASEQIEPDAMTEDASSAIKEEPTEDDPADLDESALDESTRTSDDSNEAATDIASPELSSVEDDSVESSDEPANSTSDPALETPELEVPDLEVPDLDSADENQPDTPSSGEAEFEVI